MLGRRRIAITRPRARALQTQELSLPTFQWASHADPLNAATLSAIAAGVSTRRYETTLDALPEGEVQSSVCKSAVSRRFVALSSEKLRQWLARRIEVALPAVMIDGIHFKDRVVLVALGFDAQGKKHVLGIWEGSTEKTQVARALLSDLIARGKDFPFRNTTLTLSEVRDAIEVLAHARRNPPQGIRHPPQDPS